MKKNNDNFEQSIEMLKNTPVPPGPPQQAVDDTLEKLARMQQSPSSSPQKAQFSFLKLAAAAVLLIVAGFAAGRLSEPTRLDADQLAKLETSLSTKLKPAIRNQLQQKFSEDLDSYIAASNEDFRDRLEEQFDQKLNDFAVRTLTASSTVTTELLDDLIKTIEAAQQRERLRFASALELLEYDRLQRDAQLREGLVQFAEQTENELNLTKKGITSLLANTYLGGNESQNQQEQK